MFKVQVRPAWPISAGEEGAENWVDADTGPLTGVTNEFATASEAAAYLAALQSMAILGLVGSGGARDFRTVEE